LPRCNRTARTGNRRRSSVSRHSKSLNDVDLNQRSPNARARAPALSRGAKRHGAELAPFLKWAGGKRQLLDAILRRVPDPIDTYYEPFLGGGAVFFALSNRNTFRKAVISDRNSDLIDTYRGIRDHVEEVIRLLGKMPYDRDFYYREREKNPSLLSRAERAARIIYLNRTCYNGLYRVNRRGRFNVPFGRYKQPTILDEPLLKRVSIRKADFSRAVAKAGPADFVYFDPPYYPLSDTACFTAYDNCPFGPEEQERLARLIRDLKNRRVRALLSNSDVKGTRKLYRGLRLERVLANRPINSRADRRGPITELLVRNY
jgi:DNA adenine methylase